MEVKYCIRCKENKPITEFHHNARAKDGLQRWCKTCCAEYRSEHAEELADYHAEWYIKQRDSGKLSEYNLKHADKISTRHAKYKIKHAEEIVIYNAEYKGARREQMREYDLQHKYGIGLFEYDLMLESQGGGCAICGKTPEENGKRLAVDHDHDTGRVRGLLCSKCNQALGLFQDSPELCSVATLYLLKAQED